MKAKERDLFYPLLVPNYCRWKVLEIISALDNIQRAGFKSRDTVKNESIGERTDIVVLLALKLWPEEIRLHELLKIHDWAKFMTGDLQVNYYAPAESRLSKENKKRKENEAMEKICAWLGSYGYYIYNLWLEYNEEKSESAIRAKRLDRILYFPKPFYLINLKKSKLNQLITSY